MAKILRCKSMKYIKLASCDMIKKSHKTFSRKKKKYFFFLSEQQMKILKFEEPQEKFLFKTNIYPQILFTIYF